MWFFMKKTMLQCTHEEKKQVSENYSNNDHEIYVELDTYIMKEAIDYSGISSS
jgi:hypothetical protein